MQCECVPVWLRPLKRSKLNLISLLRTAVFTIALVHTEKVMKPRTTMSFKQTTGHAILGSIISDLLRRVFAAQSLPRKMPMSLATI
jgi:hypothetical protein